MNNEMNEDLRDALRAGLRCVVDPRLWFALLAALFSWAVLLRGVIAFLLILMSVPFAFMLHGVLGAIPSFVVAAWLFPLVMRGMSAVIAARALAAAPAIGAGAPQALPSTSAAVAWWLPLMVCATVLPRVVGALPWGDSAAAGLALAALQILVASRAILRSVLAPRFSLVTVDGALRERPAFWRVVTLCYLLGLGALQWLADLVSPVGWGGLVGAFVAWNSGRLGEFLALSTALWLMLFFAAAIFATAALARFALATLAREDGSFALPVRPVVTPAPVRAPLPARAPAPVAPPRAPRTRTSPTTLAALVLILLATAFWFRAEFAHAVLGADFQLRADRHGPWGDPGVRFLARVDTACAGRTDTLRELSWLGIGISSSASDTALACAAFHGHLDTVKYLVESGDDINRAVRPIDGVRDAATQTPLQQSVHAPEGLAVTDWLLANGAQRDPATPHDPDLVQVAAAANCLPCLAWLHQHGFAMNRSTPATPMTLWFDHPAQPGQDGVADLARLTALGLSPTAVGADGRSPLHAAAAAANGAVVHRLLALGAEPDHADEDGMKPLSYAAQPLSPKGPHDAAAPGERMAVVEELLRVTSSLQGQAVPAHPRRAVIDTDPYITHPFDFSMAAVLQPQLRDLADAAGKAIHYTDGDFIYRRLEARRMLAQLDDVEISAVMLPDSSLTLRATESGWWPELARAERHWPPSHSYTSLSAGACNVLLYATGGVDDKSPGASESWKVVDAWLDAGMRPVDCGERRASDFDDLVARRSRAQQVDWTARREAAALARRP